MKEKLFLLYGRDISFLDSGFSPPAEHFLR